jgi:hypothetical protein
MNTLLLRSLLVAITMTAAPLTIRHGHVEAAAACAQTESGGQCCNQAGSICVIDNQPTYNTYYTPLHCD